MLEPGGNFLAVQGLGLSIFTAVARVQSLVGELRSRKLCSVAIKKRTRKQKTFKKKKIVNVV